MILNLSRFSALTRLLALGLALFLAAVVTSQAQESEANSLSRVFEQANKAVELISRVAEANSDDDDVLIEGRSKLLDLRPKVEMLREPLDKSMAEISAALEKLGAPPEDGSVEDTLVTEERKRLTAERNELFVLVNRSDTLLRTIESVIGDISSLRSAAFTTAITKRTPITGQSFAGLHQEPRRVLNHYISEIGNWLSRLAVDNPQKLALSILASLLFGGTVLWFKRNVVLISVSRESTRFQMLIRALVRTIMPTLVLVAAIFGFFVTLLIFELFSADIRTLITPLIVAAVSFFFVASLSRNIFSPDNADARLVPLTRHAASRMSILVIVLAAIQALDYTVSTISRTLRAPLSITIANSFLAAILIGLVLLAVLLVHKDKGVPQRAVPRWVRLPVLLVSLGIIGSALAGYIGFARFAAQQIVISGAILVTMYLGLTASRELGQQGGLAATRFGVWLGRNDDMTAERIDQYGLILSLIASAFVLLCGLPALALQWGSRIDDILTFFNQLLFGFKIGNFSFSLNNLFLGIGVFVVLVVLTRLFQRWLARNVLSRVRADVGVRHSITTGIGYTGVAIAALAGVTTAGFNLASLAIVAGALSLGIGFGLQNIVSNFVSGLILLVERPIKVGDFIETGSHVGTIKKISVRATELETIHRMSVIVPNSELINAPVGNWTHKMKNGRIDIPVGVAYGTDYKRVREILLEIASRQSEIMLDPAPFVYFVGFGASSVDMELRVHLRDWTAFPAIRSEMMFDICDAFEREGIEIPFPQTDLHIRSVDEEAARALSGSAKKPRSG